MSGISNDVLFVVEFTVDTFANRFENNVNVYRFGFEAFSRISLIVRIGIFWLCIVFLSNSGNYGL